MTSINYRESGARLRVLRHHIGQTPEAFAERLGLSKRAYLAYEWGHRRSPGWTNLIYPLLDETGVSLDWLFLGRSNLTGVRNDNRPQLIAGMRALAAEEGAQRKRASVKADGNVLTVDFIGASRARCRRQRSRYRPIFILLSGHFGTPRK